MKKTILVAAVALSALFAGSAAMAGDLSYNIGVQSNYIWRGVSQTNNQAALQGGVDYKKGVFYAGTWLSNVDFAGTGGTHADTEMDLYAGVTPTVGDWSFNFGAYYYTYPNAKGVTFGEIQADVSHSLGKGTIGINSFTPIDSLERPYYEIAASYPLTSALSISGALGTCEGDAKNQKVTHCNGVARGYQTWNAGLTYAITSNLSLDVRYSENSINARTVNGSLAAPKLYATLKASF
ncbi:MAG: TorF family putative porin [Asticcacaulis sp.]